MSECVRERGVEREGERGRVGEERAGRGGRESEGDKE